MVVLRYLAEDLNLLHRVDAEVSLEVEVRLQHVGIVSGLLGDDPLDRGGHLYGICRCSRRRSYSWMRCRRRCLQIDTYRHRRLFSRVMFCASVCDDHRNAVGKEHSIVNKRNRRLDACYRTEPCGIVGITVNRCVLDPFDKEERKM